MLFVDADQPIIKYLQKAQDRTDCEISQQAHMELISIEGGEDADEVISRFIRWLNARSSGVPPKYSSKLILLPFFDRRG